MELPVFAMNNIIKKDLIKYIINPLTLSVYLLGVLLVFIPLGDHIKSFVLQGVKINIRYASLVHGLGIYDIVAPIFAVFPSIIFFCDEWNTGYVKSIMIRSSKKIYIYSKLVSILFSGGLIVCAPLVTLHLFLFLVGEPYTLESTLGYQTQYHQTIFQSFEFMLNGFAPLIVIDICAFMFGVVWSSIGLAFASLTLNRYISLAAPFAIYFSIFICCARLREYLFSPVNLIFPNLTLIKSFNYVIVYDLCILLIGLIAFFSAIKIRLENIS